MTAPLRRALGSSGLSVHPLNLGGNVFGWTADRAASFAVLDAYREAGGNFVDTADVYSRWVEGHDGGESERMIGAWLEDRGCREDVVIATKVGKGGPEVGPGLTAQQIQRGCELSLKRLGVEQIDLYYAHEDRPETPLEETLSAFDALVKSGKVRAIGASNFSAPRLREALETSRRNGLARYTVVQPEYNLVARETLEGELADLCRQEGLGVCTYYALASGFLTGKYLPGEKPRGARAGRVSQLMDDPKAVATLERMREVAKAKGATVAQLALAWQLHRPEVTTPIASATSVDQLNELLGAVTLTLGPSEMRHLEGA
jgi:aryl-alcohol dehydrogenase (NADP+)